MALLEPSGESEAKGEVFSQLLISNRHRIYGFLYSLVHDHAAAEDLMQEVSMVLWRKFEQFEEGTDFAAWAMSVARFCALNWRRKQKRLPLALDDEHLMLLADEAVGVSCAFEDRRDDLRHCLAKLPEKLREVLWARYQSEQAVPRIAEARKISVRSVYLLLEKAHGLLLGCIRRRMEEVKP